MGEDKNSDDALLCRAVIEIFKLDGSVIKDKMYELLTNIESPEFLNRTEEEKQRFLDDVLGAGT